MKSTDMTTPSQAVALKAMIEVYSEFIEWLGPCDHDTGKCSCKEQRVLENALASLISADTSVDHRPDCEADVGDLSGECTCDWLNSRDRLAPTPRDLEEGDIAAAIEKCDWSNVPIGNKEILKAAISQLRKAVTLIEEREAKIEEDRITMFMLDQYKQQAEVECSELCAKIEEMRKALEPFGKEAERFDEIPGVYLCHDNVEIWQKPDARYAITVGDLRRARSLSGDTPTNNKEPSNDQRN